MLSITKLQIWKQFTTTRRLANLSKRMLSITKLQNLKAIHNWCKGTTKYLKVVINHKTTKFESNSQRRSEDTRWYSSCYQSQNHKIWKQFTTWKGFEADRLQLLSITKLQNLKAIHNDALKILADIAVVINRKTTKSESNSQRGKVLRLIGYSCYQSQNYKIWKQFTTNNLATTGNIKLLSITKLQNLKAIHNNYKKLKSFLNVVINHKTTKFEINSQHYICTTQKNVRCYQSQNYKIWKQFTTLFSHSVNTKKLLSITKLQNLKSIHNTIFAPRKKMSDVINRKTTKFESNSQQSERKTGISHRCYQSQNYKIWKQFTTAFTNRSKTL